jgi:hypothetical protein
VIWLLVDLLLGLVSVVALGLVTLGLWRRVKALKTDVGVLNGLAAEASDAVASIQR